MIKVAIEDSNGNKAEIEASEIKTLADAVREIKKLKDEIEKLNREIERLKNGYTI